MKQAWLIGSMLSVGLIAPSVSYAADEAGVEASSEEATAGAASSESEALETNAQAASPSSTDGNAAPSATVTTSANKRPKLYGFTFGVDVSDESSINAEPENYNNVTSLGLNVGWSVGKVLFQGGYFDPLKATASFSLQQELAGNSDLYRTSSGSANFIANAPEAYILSEQGGVLIDPNGVPRRVSGNNKRINYTDVSLGLSHSKLATLPGKIKLGGSMRWLLPTSLSSRNASLMTAWTTKLNLSRRFVDDKLSVGFNTGFTKYFHRYTTPGIHYSGSEVELQGQVITPAEFVEHGGFRNGEFGFTNGVNVGFDATDKLSFSTSYSLSSTFTYALSDCIVTLDDGTTHDTCASTDAVGDVSSGRGRRDSQVFTVGADYSLTRWVSLGASLTTAQPLRSADGHSIRQPFFSTNRNGFTSVGLSASFALEELL